MGRTLDALMQAESQEPLWPAKAPAGDGPQLQVVTGEEPAESMSYIEVGGRGRAIDASPDVLAVPAVRPAHARTPALTPPGPLTVAFQPCHHAPAPSPHMAPEIIAYHQPEHEVSRQYRALLGQILPAAAEPAGHALLFTGLGPAAGVTTALLNLAVSACTAGGREAVVVDANVQRPGLAARLGLTAGPGLSDLLAGSAALEQVVRRTAQERLHVLTGGAGQAAALSMEAVRWVVAWLRQRYDVIFLDGPAWEAEELAPLAGAADRVLLVLDQADTEHSAVRAATRGIARLGGHLGGLLVTR